MEGASPSDSSLCLRSSPEGNGMYQCFPSTSSMCSQSGSTTCSRTGTLYQPVGPCYDEFGPVKCTKKVQKGRCYKKKKPTKPKSKMIRKCALSCGFCDLRTPTPSTIVG